MSSSHKPKAMLAVALAFLAAAEGCASSSKGDDDDDGPGAVISGGSGNTGGDQGQGAMGGASAPAGRGGSMAAGRAGRGGTAGRASVTGGSAGSTSTGGSGDAPASGGVGTGGIGEGGAPESGGTAGVGVAGRGGSAVGGSAGTPAVGDGTLGSSCASDGACAAGLTCVTSTSQLLDGKSPGGGLCTLPCQSDAECEDFASGSFCVAFDADTTVTYCLEGCQAGVAGEPKCHERPEFACSLIGLVPTSTGCVSSDDCSSTELCATTEEPPVCGGIVTGCVPNCGGDFDCGAGEFCEFASGLCVPTPPSGRAIGALCDPNAATDPCAGFCQAKDEAGTEGVCAAFCTIAPGLLGCGWDGSAPADAACLYATRLAPDPGIGDVGICGALCDCNADCAAAGDRCMDESNGDILTLWGRAGYCRPLQTGESEADSVEQCP